MCSAILGAGSVCYVAMAVRALVAMAVSALVAMAIRALVATATTRITIIEHITTSLVDAK